jgi:hypothetical protein
VGHVLGGSLREPVAASPADGAAPEGHGSDTGSGGGHVGVMRRAGRFCTEIDGARK